MVSPPPPTRPLASQCRPALRRRYISAGYNPAFDTFDCQLHNFESPADNKLVGKLQWRIKVPCGLDPLLRILAIRKPVSNVEKP